MSNFNKSQILFLAINTFVFLFWNPAFGQVACDPASIRIDLPALPSDVPVDPIEEAIALSSSDPSGRMADEEDSNLKELLDSGGFGEQTIAYPNPSKGVITIALGQDFAQEKQILLMMYDLNGKRVREKSIVMSPETTQVTWDTGFEEGNLPSGVYLLEVRGKSYQVSNRVIMEVVSEL